MVNRRWLLFGTNYSLHQQVSLTPSDDTYSWAGSQQNNFLAAFNLSNRKVLRPTASPNNAISVIACARTPLGYRDSPFGYLMPIACHRHHGAYVMHSLTV